MEDISPVDRDYELCILLGQTRDAICKARKRELEQYSVLPEQALVLFIIQAIGNEATPAEISRWLFREPHSVSGILERMKKDGLVRKAKDLHRKNLIRVMLTEKGQQAYNQSLKRKSIHQIMSSLSEEERQQLRSYLERLRSEALKHLVSRRKILFP